MTEGVVRRKRLARAAGLRALRVLLAVVRRLPLGTALALGRGLGGLMRLASRRRYEVALSNLRVAFGDAMDEEERRRVARACFRHFGMFAVEGMRFPYLSDAEVLRRVSVPPDVARRADELKSRAQGALLLTAHLGNFEIAGRWASIQGIPIIALARPARDAGTTALMKELRARNGIQVVTLGESLRPVLAGLRKGSAVAIVCDQNAADIFVPFFGRPTGTVDGPARLALRTGVPMLVAHCVRDGRGGYTVGLDGELDAAPTGDERADVERIMADVNRLLEAGIRRHPEQWLWFHDRWRASPPVEPADGNQP